MAREANDWKEEDYADAREIPKWARRYAQNRTIPVLVALGIFLLGFGVFAGLSYLTARAAKNDQRILAGASAVLLSGFAAWWMWFAFVGGSRIIQRISQRLYRAEGNVSLGGTVEIPLQKVPHGPVFFLLFCVMAHVMLGLVGLLRIEYMQPTSALYVIPFLVYLSVKLRGVGSPFMLLWPLLYGLHAILLVAGAPIYFSGPYTILNMFIPTAGYGFLAALTAHIYSRMALRRLRRLAASSRVVEQPEGAAQ